MGETVNTIVNMEGICKSFLSVQALDHVDFSLLKGEIHALVGENGAGKSTLIKILTGVEQPDAGIIRINGQKEVIRSTQHAQVLGISTVYQEVNLCPHLSVAENILIGREPHKFGFIDRNAMNAAAREILRGLGVDMDVTLPLGTCSVAVQQMAAIARALDTSLSASDSALIAEHYNSSLGKKLARLTEQAQAAAAKDKTASFTVHLANLLQTLSPDERRGLDTFAATGATDRLVKLLDSEAFNQALLRELEALPVAAR